MRYLLALILLSGCGHTWKQVDQNTFTVGCLSTATSGTATATQAGKYCTCMLSAVMSNWTAEDYASNAIGYSAQLFSDGTVDSCRTTAGL